MSDLITIHQAARELGVSTKTLRRWEENKYFVPERDLNTNVRLYHPFIVGYWKKLLELDRSIKNHLKLLDGVKKELDKYMLEQDYIPGRPLKLLTENDFKNFSMAHDRMDKWEKDWKRMLREIMEYPKSMLKATTEYEDLK
jgi:DNA-binding transcriptional MerR regulator